MAQPQQVATVPNRNETLRQRQQRLEGVASGLLKRLKNTPELRRIKDFDKLKVAILGGLAVCRYSLDYRRTEDVDFLITSQTSPGLVCEILAVTYPDLFECSFGFFYMKTDNDRVRIDFIPDHLVPCAAQGLVSIENLNPNVLPYVSQKTLIVFKAFCCGLRGSEVKAIQDAKDAYHLVQDISPDGSTIQLDYHQAQVIHKALEDLEKFSKIPGGWWQARFQIVLGLEWAPKLESKE